MLYVPAGAEGAVKEHTPEEGHPPAPAADGAVGGSHEGEELYD